MAEFRLGRLKFSWKGNWATSTAYVIDDIVKYGANTYVCTTNHTSSANENLFYASDDGNWSLHTESIASKGEWVADAWYKINDIVKYGNSQYRVKAGFSTSTLDTTDTNKLEEYISSFNYEDSWDAATAYQVGDVVAYGGYTYVATSDHTNKPPAYNLTADWDILTTGFNVVGTWDTGTDYTQGNVVIYGGFTYVAISTSTNVAPSSSTDKWSLVSKGFEWKGNWDANTTYLPGEVVKRLSNSYVGIVTTLTNLNQDPSTDGPGNYWNVLIEGADTNVMTTSGDMVYYTTGATRLPTGTDGKVLTVNSSGLPNWETSNVTHPVYYVTEEGSDSNDGSNISRSFASVKHACGIATGPATIYVKAGTYEESLPIVVPTEVSIVGDNLRTSRIKPQSGDAHYQVVTLASVPQPTFTVTSANYNTANGNLLLTIGTHTLNVNDKVKLAEESIVFSCNFNGATGSAAQKSYPRATGANTPSGADYAYDKALTVTAITSNTITVNVNKKPGEAISISNTHQFVSAAGGGLSKAAPYISYGTTISNGAGTKTASILEASYDEKTVHIRPMTGGLWTTSDTWENLGNDIAITNVEQRSNAESVMFFMSDKTMLKDLLMEGMTGFVKAGQVLQNTGQIADTIVTGTEFYPDLVGTTVTGTGVAEGTKVINFISATQLEVDKTQTVSSTQLTYTASPEDLNNATIKGVFVQMNPETPITKSPYISNCSCQSVGGVGAIVDGNVHRQFADDGETPSNKSIVMDSFTQIHDDGVGFWITNNAAAELVSSFTYYCHVSYCATRGGRIRSLAGNSSWGNYAIVSSGFNQQEKHRAGQIEGLMLEYEKDSKVIGGDGTAVNDLAVGERIRGNTSEAIGYINSIQGGDKTLIYYSLITAGPAGVGTGFVQNETITGLTNGTTATLHANGQTANRGQSGFTIVASGLSTSPTLTANGSIEFVTGSGNGGFNNSTITGADPFTFVIDGVSQTGADGRGSLTVDRAQWSTSGAAHTGGTKALVHYPVGSGSATFLTPAASGDTTINVNTISGFNPGEYVLSPTKELMKIVSLNSATQMTVTRAQDGAAAASAYNIGEQLVSIGATSLLTNSVELWKDCTSTDTDIRVVTPTPFTENDFYKIDNEFVKVVGLSTDATGITVLTLVEEKAAKCFDEQNIKIRYLYSQARLTGHDFLQVGTGGTVTTNWPDVPTVDPIQSQEITEGFPGRVFYVSTDQDGNFRVGKYFRVNQATGSATLNASAFDLSGLTSLQLGSIGAQLGAQINEFSTDGTMSQNSPNKCPTQSAVRTYVGIQTVGTLQDAVSRADAGIKTSFESVAAPQFFTANS